MAAEKGRRIFAPASASASGVTSVVADLKSPTPRQRQQQQRRSRKRLRTGDALLAGIGVVGCAWAVYHVAWQSRYLHESVASDLRHSSGLKQRLDAFKQRRRERKGASHTEKRTDGIGDERGGRSVETKKRGNGIPPRDKQRQKDQQRRRQEPRSIALDGDELEDEDTREGMEQMGHASRASSSSAAATLHPLSGLDCTDHGGPSSSKVVEEMVFWSDIPSDASFKSPMLVEGAEEKFLSFEPDRGGWNNIRMAMETALVMAHAMGRTLVLPPQQGIYLLTKKDGGATPQKSTFGFTDFFHLDAIALEHEGFKVITMDEFLGRMGLSGKLIDQKKREVKFPPKNETDYNNVHGRREQLQDYLRSVATVPEWDPWECALGIPASTDPKDSIELNNTFKSIMDGSYGKPRSTLEEFNGKPTPVDAPMAERMREMLADRNGLCIYDRPLQEARLVHLKCEKNVRMLTHFYAFIFFADWKQDLWSKRFVRDHLRYVDEIVCAAARVVEAVREHARARNSSDAEGIYDAMHVRRGDFQFQPTRLPAEELYLLSKDELTENATLYIATDEKSHDFFEPIASHYNAVYLDDFKHVLEGVNTNLYGMIDQLVSYKSRVFYGTWWSTLSGYVNRMRGYYIAKHKLDGHEDGTMRSFYFTPEERRLQMRQYIPVRKPLYPREFPTSWRNIDLGIEEIAATKSKL